MSWKIKTGSSRALCKSTRLGFGYPKTSAARSSEHSRLVLFSRSVTLRSALRSSRRRAISLWRAPGSSPLPSGALWRALCAESLSVVESSEEHSTQDFSQWRAPGSTPPPSGALWGALSLDGGELRGALDAGIFLLEGSVCGKCHTLRPYYVIRIFFILFYHNLYIYESIYCISPETS